MYHCHRNKDSDDCNYVKRMIKYKNELCFLGTCNKKQRCNYFKIAPGEAIMGNVANTVLRGKLPIKELQRKILRREMTTLKKLATKKVFLNINGKYFHRNGVDQS